MIGIPSLLIAAGLDPCGGAGLIADVQVAQHFDCRATGVVTASTVQNSRGVLSTRAQSTEHIANQLACLGAELTPSAVKIGMLPSADHARVLAQFLSGRALPVVWDPVLRPTSGTTFFDGDVSEAVTHLASVVSLVTPNTDELAKLTGIVAIDLDTVMSGANALLERGFAAVLVKGGHWGVESSSVVDVLVSASGHQCFQAPRILGANVHGTGCALSTAIAASLCHGRDIVASSQLGIDFVRDRIAKAASTGHPSIW